MTPDACVFCAIITGHTHAEFVWRWDDAVAILPRENDGKRGCTEGHILVIPRVHVRDFTESSYISAITAARASELAYHLGGQWNELTSAGADATQSVWHLHRHLVPRREGDGLRLPWTGQAVAQ